MNNHLNLKQELHSLELKENWMRAIYFKLKRWESALFTNENISEK